MPLTNFPFGVSTMGYPVVPPIPFMSDSIYYYVDVVNGADGNSGTDPSQALKTIAKGYTLLRAGHYDTLFVIGLGTAFTLTAPLLWTKDYTNLVGITAPIDVSQRARITSGVATISPMITFSGTGITVKNLQLAQFGSDATLSAQCVLVQGQRDYFENVHFAGGGNATVRAGTAMRSLTIDGQNGNGEHMFNDCTIGLDTVDNSGANYEMDIINISQRNYFRNCRWIKRATTASGGFISFPTSFGDRWQLFDRPIFINFAINGGTVMTTGLNIADTTSGYIIMNEPLFVGCTGLSGGAKANFFTNNAVAAATVGVGLEPSS